MKLTYCLLLSFLTFSCAKPADPTPITSPNTIEGVTTFTVTAPNGNNNYSINSFLNPTLVVKRGTTYTFNITAATHPFYIKTVQSAGTADAFNTGVTGNGTETGTITFVVPATAPATLYYNCAPHALMTGMIKVID